MKNINKLLLAIAILLVACGPSKEELISFNERMVDGQLELIKNKKDYNDVISNKGDINQIKNQLEKWEKSTLRLIDEFEKEKDYKETKELRETFLKLANLQLEFIQNEANDFISFLEILQNLKEGEDFPQEKLNDIILNVEIFENQTEEQNKNLIKVQKEFAEKNNITL